MNTSATEAGRYIKGILQMFFRKEGTRSLRSRLAKGAAGIFTLKVASIGLSFIIGLLLARILGTAGYGTYSYVLAWVGVLSVPAVLGLDRMLVRDIASYHARSEWCMIKGLLRWSNKIVLLVSLAIVFLAASIAIILSSFSVTSMLVSFWVSLLILPFASLTRLRQASLQGFHRVVQGQLPELLIQPMLMLVLTGIAYFFWERCLTAQGAVGINVVTVVIAFVVGVQFLLKTLPKDVKETPPAYQARIWLRSALPLMFISGMQIINNRTATIMLGAIKGAEAVGIYVVASRGAELITFALLAVNSVLAPAVSGLYAVKDMKRLQGVITKSARMVLAFSLPVALGLIIFGEWFLLLFGKNFIQGQTALTILSIGQIISASAGSVGLLLTMTGHERDTALGVGSSAIVNIVLNAILIPLWGLNGAAIATTSSMVLWNILLAIWVYKRIGIHSTALGEICFFRKISN